MNTTEPTILISSANGIHQAADSPDWRLAAMDAALKNRAEDGSPPYAVIAALKRQNPQAAIRYFDESKKRVYDALPRFLQLTVVVPSPFDTDKGAADNRMCGWWQGVSLDNGATYEIVLSPNGYESGEWVVCGTDEAAVNCLVDAIIADATKHTCRSLRFANGEWHDAPEMEAEIAAVAYTDIVLSPALLSDIESNVNAFFKQKAIFQRLGFSWRRGVLLVGPPGTGKTMLCKAAANAHPEVHFLYVRDLGQPGSRRDNILPIFEKARRLAPCILAIEDMDGLIHKDNRTTFLNELDGFKNNDGLLIIASSNHPERIDEALLKRPSRFDRVYHIGVPELAERTEYCRRLLTKSPMPLMEIDTDALAAQIAAATDGFTPAFLKEAILSAMLGAAQSGQETLGADFGSAVLEQVNLLKTYLKKAKNPEALAEMNASSGDIGFRSR